MDNARIHSCNDVLDDLLELFEQKGIKMCFQPSYSPELNAAELYFGWIKRNLQYSPSIDLRSEVVKKLNIIPQDTIMGFYQHAIYGWTKNEKITPN